MAQSLLVHASVSLDAASYIISMGLVDVMMFGRPARTDSPSEDEKRKHAEGVHRYGSTPRRTASDPGTGHSTSGTAVFYDAPSILSLQEDFSDNTDVPVSSPRQRRYGSLDDYRGTKSAFAPFHRQRSSPHTNVLHHHQAKILTKQIQRAVRIQPYVRFFLVLLLLLAFTLPIALVYIPMLSYMQRSFVYPLSFLSGSHKIV